MSARISKDRSQAELISTLVRDKDKKIFETEADLLAFAAVLGYHKGQRLELGSKDQVAPIELFIKRQLDGIFDLICIAETGDETLFYDNADSISKRIQIFEEYAKGGLKIIDDKYKATPTTDLDLVFQSLFEEVMHNDDSYDFMSLLTVD